MSAPGDHAARNGPAHPQMSHADSGPSRLRLAPILVWSGMALIGLSSLVIALQLLPEEAGQVFFLAVRLLTATVAGAAILVESRRAQGRLRRARALVGIALLVGALSGVIMVAIFSITGHAPQIPSIVDFVYFLIFPLIIAGLLSYPVSEIEAGSGLRSVLDGVIAGAALWFCVYVLLLAPVDVGAGVGTAERLTLLAYPAAAVFVIGMIASVISRVSDDARRELMITCWGLLLMSVFEVAYTAQVATTGSLRFDNWIGALAEIGLGVVLLAAVLSKKPYKPRTTVTRWLPVLPFALAITAIVIGCALVLRDAPVTAAEFAIGLLALVLLMLRLLVESRDKGALLQRLSRREQLFRSLVLDSSDLITLQAPDGRIRYVSPAMARFTGRPEDVLIGSRFDDLINPQDLPGASNALTDVRATPGLVTEYLCRIRGADENWRWMQSQMHNLMDDPSVAGIVCNTRDVHDRHVLEQRLLYAAYHDALTGLGNLARARELLEQHCYGPAGVRGSVILVDLDGFKAINDTYGHPFGDQVLHVIGERLRRCVPGTDRVTRIGGDEFVIVLDDDAPTTRMVEQIMQLYRQPVMVGGIGLSVAASVGVALAVDASDSDELLRNADLAMYVAKSEGRNRAYWYEPYMYEASSHRMEITRGLRRALDEGHFSLNYQPIVRLADSSLVGCEALLRWDDPDHGRIDPDAFISIAEESGLIIEIGAWVLEQLCADVAGWRATGLTVPRVSMNVSRRQITQDLPPLVRAALRRHGLRGSDLCVEITESAVLADAREAVSVLQQIRELGVTIALDDFGTGQSSVSQLTTLPVDQVKIDKSFVVTERDVPNSSTLLRSIVTLCANLSLPTIAEGVEDRATALELMAAGCEFGQGFYFARPQPAAALGVLLSSSVPIQRQGGSSVPLAGR